MKNYINVRLKILNEIFRSQKVLIPVSRRWTETLRIKLGEETTNNLILLSVGFLNEMFLNKELPIPVSKKWITTLNFEIETEEVDYVTVKNETPKIESVIIENNACESGAVSFYE